MGPAIWLTPIFDCQSRCVYNCGKEGKEIKDNKAIRKSPDPARPQPLPDAPTSP